MIDTPVSKDLKNFSKFNIVQNNIKGQTHGTAVLNIIIKYSKHKSFNVNVYPLKKMNTTEYIDNIKKAIEDDVDIIHLSNGIRNYNKKLENTIKKAENKGIIVIAAAGNNYGMTMDYPARFKETISIGSLDKNNTKSKSNPYEEMDFYELGEDINTINKMGSDITVDGNSFSAAIVTGKLISIFNTKEFENLNKKEILKKLEDYHE